MTHRFTLITGAGAGIGKELAIVCAKKGFNLLLVSLPGSDLAGLSAALSQQYPINVQYFEVDLTGPTAPERVFQWCVNNGFVVDKLINNVGMGGSRKFEDLQLPEIQSMILLNTYVLTSITNLFLPMLKQQPKAYILNVSSTASFFNIPYKAVYAATKAFVNTFTSSLRNELADTRIVVSVLCPGGSMHKRDAHVEMKISRSLSDMLHEKPEAIAQAGIRGMLAGKRMILPGLVAKSYVFVSRIIPTGLADPVIRRLFMPAPEGRRPGRTRRLALWSVAIVACLAVIFAVFFRQTKEERNNLKNDSAAPLKQAVYFKKAYPAGCISFISNPVNPLHS